MKKVLCLIFVSAFLVSLWGCKDSKSAESTPSAVPTVSPSPTPAPQMVKIAQVKEVDPGLNIRSAASSEGEILGMAETGDRFLLLVDTEKDGWYQIEYEGKTAYISAEYADVKEITLTEASKLREPQDTSASSNESSQTSLPEPQSKTNSPSPSASANSRHAEDGEQ